MQKIASSLFVVDAISSCHLEKTVFVVASMGPRRWSMPRFISHEPLSLGYFNSSYNGGTGAYSAWQGHLANDRSVVDLLVQRLASDYEALPVKLRKAWGAKEVDAWANVHFVLHM